jgi:archaellum biogenesis protein FlaJ (TadC family)
LVVIGLMVGFFMVEDYQQQQLWRPPKTSSKTLSKPKLFFFVMLPVSVLIFAYIVTPSSWGFRTLAGTIWSLCYLAAVFVIGGCIAMWGNLKIPGSTTSSAPWWAELAGILLEVLLWLLFFAI